MPRIVHLIHSGAIGGGPRVVLDLATHIPGDHTIMTADDGPLLDNAAQAGLDIVRLAHAGEFSFGLSLPVLVRHFRGVDLVHLHGQFAAFYGAAAAAMARTPCVYTAHFPSFVTDAGPVTVVRNAVAEALPCRMARVVVACSQTSREEYVRRKLVRAQNIVTIYNGVGEPPATPAPDSLRHELALGDAPIIVGIGRFTDQKGFDLLIDAFVLLLSRLPNAKLLLVGDGPLRTALEARAERLGVSPSIRFTGFRHDTAALMRLASVVVVPSVYDIFPLVVLEAMRAGRPVVASDLAPFREALRQGETGILSRRSPDAFANAISTLMLDPSRAADMGESACRDARLRFGVERMVAEYTGLYLERFGLEA